MHRLANNVTNSFFHYFSHISVDISLYKSESQIKTDDVAGQGHKRKSESSPKAVSPLKKIKPNTKTSKDPPPNRRKNESFSVAPQKKNKTLTKRSGKVKLE